MRSGSHAHHRVPAAHFGVGNLFRLLLLVGPGLVLLFASLRQTGEPQQVLLIGAGFQAAMCLLGFLTQAFRRQPLSVIVILLYGLGLAWLFLAHSEQDWYFHFARATLLIIPLIALALQSLNDGGVLTLRRARVLARRIAARREWPGDFDACRRLPEVKALRESLHLDASPALELLSHPRPQVQIAALSALDFRKHWRAGQSELVLQIALRAEHPSVRAAALSALANVENRIIVESLAEHLRDPASEVRRAARESLLWDNETRWPWIRHAIRRSLADPLCKNDGPLYQAGAFLTPMAIGDLTAWATEKGLVGLRAALTLAAYYDDLLNEEGSGEIIEHLRSLVRCPRSSAVLRIEMTRVLGIHEGLDEELLEQMIRSGNPAPLRLLAAEVLLATEAAPDAVMVLRELARLPNREITLATADVVQRCLNVELGLVQGQPMPALHSRQAAEVSRRVMTWAEQESGFVMAPTALRQVAHGWPQTDPGECAPEPHTGG